jgi:AraC-like DNA-binding protein
MGPFGRMPRRHAFMLRPEQIHPVVRIAHRQQGGLVIPDRIIFDHELVLIVKGSGQWKIGGESYGYATNDLLFVPPFVPHSFHDGGQSPTKHLAIHFDFEAMPPSASEVLADRAPYRVQFTHGLKIAQQRALFSGHRWARDLVRLVTDQNSGGVVESAQASMRLAGVLLEMLSERKDERSAADPIILRQQARVNVVVDHMSENLCGTINHRALEQVSKLSTSRLQALFREVTGYPPLDYLRRLRVEKARRLLADQQLSVKEIAGLTGFRDTSHLSKVFRRIDGLSPARYREALLAGRQEK